MKVCSVKDNSDNPHPTTATTPPKTVCAKTCAETAERYSVLSKEVVAGGVVIVLHHEANQSQVRTMDSEVKGAVPTWVEA